PLRGAELRGDRPADAHAGQHAQVALRCRPQPAARPPGGAGLSPGGERIMNCAAVRARLASLLYGDLPTAEADEVRQHLAGCPSCREEQTAITGLRPLLDAVPAPAVAVDLPRLYRDAAAGQTRRLRRWRGAAVAALAVAAAVVVALLLSRL